MKKYHVTYCYHAQGMDKPDFQDYGIIEAESEGDAIEAVVMKLYPIDVQYGPDNAWSTRDFIRFCMQASEVVDVTKSSK